ncbi:disulfide bond formation protein B [Microbulbifer sp. 2205BS26-8]|uniref:disulfide bond formation protein B n=1 Tax=Microbulbifer sp. 2205BS26-8 TaxID=3064386 RepID=UPI00273E45DF|nr:disulfide bond formation protein B [Microbulbifer sp. 2205BS26-8]MDP5210481.1 disulfide bond formation protein B [Microbulbifer sp. 2205BS26-8]
MRRLDTLTLLAVTIALWFAIAVEVFLHQLPCPLCLLQRVAFTMVGIGLLLNLRFGVCPMHYGVVILSSLAGLAVAARQVLLHILPGNPGFGSPFLGLHLYTWAAIAFFALLAYSGTALMLAFARQNGTLRRFSFPEKCVVMAFFAIALINLISTVFECGPGPCTSHSFGYHWFRPWLGE